jgi:ribosomal protein L12E/L44/L45/RPP1/RPP2
VARNQVFRVYDDEEAMLTVYHRRLGMADKKFEQRKPQLEAMLREYDPSEVSENEVTTSGHVISVTIGSGIIDTLFSSMTAVNVDFLVKNIGRGTPEQAVAASNALSQGWKDTKGQRRAKEAIKDALLVDQGWVKVYYDHSVGVEERNIPRDKIRQQIAELKGERPDITDEELRELIPTVEDVEVVLRNRITVDYVPYDKVRYDPTAKRIEDIRWVAQYTSMPVAEVQLNPEWQDFVIDRYGEANGLQKLRELKGDSVIATGLETDISFFEELGKEGEEDDQRVTVVEMCDLETGVITLFPRNQKDLVLYQYTNPLMFNLDLEDRNPYKPLKVRNKPNQFEGVGDMRFLLPNIEELKEYRWNLAQHVRRTVPKIIGPEQALGAGGRKALASTEWAEYVGLQNNLPASAIQPLIPPSLPQEAYGVPDRIIGEMKESTGANEVLRGVFPTKRTTATETSLVTDAGERRQAERRDALMQWYVDIGTTMLQLMQKFYDQERMARFTDEAGQEFEWTWTNEDIAIESELEVSITPKEMPTRDTEFSRALQVFNLAVPLPETDRAEALRMVLRAMGLREEEVRAIVRTQEEIDAEQAAEQAQGLAVQPPPYGSAPQGLSIRPT